VERLLRPKEACQLLSISYSTLLRWIREGKIRVVTTEGGKYRIPYSEIKKYLERREETRAVIYARVSSTDQKRGLGEASELPNKLRNGEGLQGS
jgi:DNA binding domain, excisionase family